MFIQVSLDKHIGLKRIIEHEHASGIRVSNKSVII